MRLKLLIVSLSSLALVSGCVTPSGDFCDIARPIYIGDDYVVDWLSENDEGLLRSVVSHNEMTEKCL
jgi:hypothetical protein